MKDEWQKNMILETLKIPMIKRFKAGEHDFYDGVTYELYYQKVRANLSEKMWLDFLELVNSLPVSKLFRFDELAEMHTICFDRISEKISNIKNNNKEKTLNQKLQLQISELKMEMLQTILDHLMEIQESDEYKKSIS